MFLMCRKLLTDFHRCYVKNIVVSTTLILVLCSRFGSGQFFLTWILPMTVGKSGNQSEACQSDQKREVFIGCHHRNICVGKNQIGSATLVTIFNLSFVTDWKSYLKGMFPSGYFHFLAWVCQTQGTENWLPMIGSLRSPLWEFQAQLKGIPL